MSHCTTLYYLYTAPELKMLLGVHSIYMENFINFYFLSFSLANNIVLEQWQVIQVPDPSGKNQT
jgi:hypothetical protein